MARTTVDPVLFEKFVKLPNQELKDQLDPLRKEILCTACHNVLPSNSNLTGGIYSHPTLKVIICGKCHHRLISNDLVIQRLCQWCGRPAEKISCTKCRLFYCMKCISNRFQADLVHQFLTDKEFTCFICIPALLAKQRLKCVEVLRSMEDTNQNSTPSDTTRKRTGTDPQMQPSKRYRRTRSLDALDSGDELHNFNFPCDTNQEVPTTEDYRTQIEEIIDKADDISSLCLDVSLEALNCKKRLKNHDGHPKRLQAGFAFTIDLINSTVDTLNLWKKELNGIDSTWREKFRMTLSTPNQSADEELNHGPEGHSANNKSSGICSNGDGKKNRFRLSLKRTFNSEFTDDDVLAKNAEDSKLMDNEHNKTEDQQISNGLGANESGIIPEPRTEEEDDHHSIFSQDTVLAENLSGSTEDVSELCSRTLCETTGYFIVGSNNSDENIVEIKNMLDVEDDANSENSFVFDLGNRSSEVPMNQCDDSDATDCEEDSTGLKVTIMTVKPIQENLCDSEIGSETSKVKAMDDETMPLTHYKEDVVSQHYNSANEAQSEEITNSIKDDHFAESSFSIDLIDNKVEVDVDDKKDVKVKLDFLESLGLCTNDADESEANDTDETNEELVRRAVTILQEDDSHIFDSDPDTSDSSSSEEADDSADSASIIFNNPKRFVHRAAHKPSKEYLDTCSSDSNSSAEEDAVNNVKPCQVLLERLLEKKKPTSSVDDELRQIDRLTDLNNLEQKRKVSSPPVKKKAARKRRRIIKTCGSSGSENKTDSDSDCNISEAESLTLSSPSYSLITVDYEESILQRITSRSPSVCSSETSDIGSNNEDTLKKKKKRPNSAGSNKENEPVCEKKDFSIETKQKNKWRNDALLRERFTESGTDVESEENVEGDNLLSEKSKKKMEKLEKKLKDRIANKLNLQTANLPDLKCEKDSDKESRLSSDAEDETNDKQSKQIVINTDTDSDIEFISEIKKKSPLKSPRPRNSIYISSGNEDSDPTLSDDSDAGSKTKGRRNIRAILSDETLEAATKKANLIEKQRKDRLSQKHKNMDSFMSQSESVSQSDRLVLDMNENSQSPTVVVHSRLVKRLKNHQKEGVRFMWESCYESLNHLKKDPGSGCILAHCMGLGKTFQVVTLIHTLFAHPATTTKHVLVVCPLSIVLNWDNEFKKGLENLNDDVKVEVFCISERYSNPKRRLFIVDKWRAQTGVLVMGYEAYQRLTKFRNQECLTTQEINIKKALIDPGPDLVILDEGHLLKNGKNCRTKALMKVKTKRRIILTGTPLQNNLKEYYFMVQFVKPNLLGSYLEYTNRFVNPITNGQYDDSTESDIRQMKKRSHVLNKLLRATIQRYEVSELCAYLPSKFDYVLFIQLHPLQALLYEQYLEQFVNKQDKLFANYHRLQVIWTHPCLLHLTEQKRNQKKSKEVDVIVLDPEVPVIDESPEGWWHHLCPDDYKTNIDYGPKFRVMLSIIQECEKIGDKVLIFSSSLVELDAIELFLQHHATPTSQWKLKEDYYRMDGGVLPEARLKMCNFFSDRRNNKARVFLISHKVGGLGLNLAAANRVILMDVSWNPAYDSQSVFRTYRFGQEKQCYVYRLVSMGTMEEVVYERQVNKLAISARVVDEQQISRHYKSMDLQKMYRMCFRMDDERPVVSVPSDALLATVIQSCPKIFKYHEHQALLENKPEEELNEHEMEVAWDEFNKENEKKELLVEQHKKRMMQQMQMQQMQMQQMQMQHMQMQNQPQPGPSGITNYLSTVPRTQFVGPQLDHFMSMLNKPTDPNHLVQLNNGTVAQNEDATRQPFESVFLANNLSMAFNTEETTEFRSTHMQLPVLPPKKKPSELSEKFYSYLNSLKAAAATNSGNNASGLRGGTVQPEAPQAVNDVQPNQVINVANSTNGLVGPLPPPETSGIVMPQIVKTFSHVKSSKPRKKGMSGGSTALPKARRGTAANKVHKHNNNIIDVDADGEQQSLIRSLKNNLDITLSLRNKPPNTNARDCTIQPDVSIKSEKPNTLMQRGTGDVIQID